MSLASSEGRQFREVQENISLWALLSRRYSLKSLAAKLQVVDWGRKALAAQREQPAAELNWRGVRWKEFLRDGIPFMQEGFSMVGTLHFVCMPAKMSGYSQLGFPRQIQGYPNFSFLVRE